MGHRAGMLRRPVRAAAIVAAVVALIGSGAAFIPGVAVPHVLALALGYGIFSGAYGVGLALASESSAVRWWRISSALPLASTAIIAIGLRCWPESLLRWWAPITGVALIFVVAWLSAGSLLAILGWWYARDRRRVADS
jgi:hypothetical protein